MLWNVESWMDEKTDDPLLKNHPSYVMTQKWTHEDLQLLQEKQAALIKNRQPMRLSKWQRFLQVDACSGHEIQCGTLFSGGHVITTREKYARGFPIKADDICRGVVLTDNETYRNSEGGGMAFFEVDWKDDTCLPTMEQLKVYMRELCKLLREWAPSAAFKVWVAVNTPRSKCKKGNSSKRYYSMGFHIIVQDLLVTSVDNKNMAFVQNKRITSIEPVWANKTDLEPYKSDGGMLRPIFSHKVDPCEQCAKYKALDREKEKDTVPEDSDKPKPKKSKKEKHPNCLNDTCFNTVIANSNIYRLAWMMIPETSELVPTMHISLQAELQCTSILRPPEASTFPRLTPPWDALSLEQLQQLKKSPSKNRTPGINLHAGSFKAHYFFCNALLERFAREQGLDRSIKWFVTDVKMGGFTRTESNKLKKTSNKAARILLQVSGPKYCLLVRREHVSNNIFFTLRPSDGRLRFQCQDADCKKMESETKKIICMQLRSDEKTKFHQLFFGGQGEASVKSEENVKSELQLIPKEQGEIISQQLKQELKRPRITMIPRKRKPD